MRSAVDGFSVFRDAVAIQGWVFGDDGPPPALEYRPRVGPPHRFAPAWFASDDVAAVHGEAARGCRFDVVLPGLGRDGHGTLWAVSGGDDVELLATLGDGLRSPADEVADTFIRAIRMAELPRVLEIGSRARSGTTHRDKLPPQTRYSGCDIMAGPNVDVVCDAHALSTAFPAGEFDAVMAYSVLEHLLMPWKFVLELNHVMAPGALGLFCTHQCWPLHDAPWDYWRFSDRAWAGLLNEATGFEIVAAAMGDPAHIVAANRRETTAFGWAPAGFLTSNVLFRKTGETALRWPVDLARIATDPYPV